jgi:hypothetical protein
METNKIDNNIQKKFENRTFEPSASAWERLSVQLDEQPKQKKFGWFFYIGAAASILLLVSLGIQLFSDNTDNSLPKNEVVIEKIDNRLIEDKFEQLKQELPIEKAIVIKDEVKVQKAIEVAEKYKVPAKEKSRNKVIQSEIFRRENISIVAKVEPEIKQEIPLNKELKRTDTFKQNPNSRIKINSDDLLFAVTHSPQEVEKYYAKYNVNREDVLKTIRNQLKESNIKINPNTILAEVERTIDDDDFQNNFMKSLKRKVSDIASAIASRND